VRLIYVDTSAAIKLFKDEVESDALQEWLVRQSPARQITSHLTRTELRRGLHAIEAIETTRQRADQWLRRCARIALAAQVCDRAGDLAPSSRLRSLDALHVAAALSLAPAVTHFVTYDKRLREAAEDNGLTTVSPE
jgi:uncharacterized protein